VPRLARLLAAKGKAMRTKSALILCPHPSEQGGVADYYRLLNKHFRSERMKISFYYTGNRSGTHLAGHRLIKTLTDLFGLAGIARGHDLIILNPSLDTKAVIRDGLYHLLAKKILRKKTMIFFHGWDRDFENRIDRHLKTIFRATFNCDRGVVLAGAFKEKLISWGFDREKIAVETTVYEQFEAPVTRDLNKMIFLSRFVKGKGCLVAIQTMEILAKQFPGLKLFMVGDGPLTAELKDYVKNGGFTDSVEFTGWLNGDEKYRLLKQCGIMLYPTDFGEGLPICLLEGMGSGLAVVTRPVAGIPDVFTDGENGYLVPTNAPEDFAAKVGQLLNDRSLWERISKHNSSQAKARFEISNVANRMEDFYYRTAQ
jgi:glycosyltransferase involved in cell wall biosynthesis